jgi:hypothetical protein
MLRRVFESKGKEVKSEGKRSLWGPKRRWEDNIKVSLKEIGCDGVVWFRLSGQDSVEGFRENSNGPSGSIKCG